MRAATINVLAESFTALRVILDRAVEMAGPAAIAIGGEAPLFYFGLALLSAQLWRVNVRVD
jgi:hypothetical protein